MEYTGNSLPDSCKKINVNKMCFEIVTKTGLLLNHERFIIF